MANIKDFLRKGRKPEWTMTFPGDPHAGPIPENSVLFRHPSRMLTVLAAVENIKGHVFLHVSGSRHDGLLPGNEECKWLAADLLINDLHFREVAPPQLTAIREIIRETVSEIAGQPLPEMPLVRHFYHEVR